MFILSISYTKDTVTSSSSSSSLVPDNIISTVEEHEIINQVPLVEIPQHIDDDSQIEFFECQKCGEFNIISSKVKKRRATKVRHVKVNDVTWGSLKRYATINGVTMDYALMTALHALRTKNISYLINERKLIDNKNLRRNNKRK